MVSKQNPTHKIVSKLYKKEIGILKCFRNNGPQPEPISIEFLHVVFVHNVWLAVTEGVDTIYSYIIIFYNAPFHYSNIFFFFLLNVCGPLFSTENLRSDEY